MPVTPPTVDELVEALKRSHLPTILVEGDTDMTIFRWIVEKINLPNIDLLSCNGRSTLLDVYARRSEFPQIKVAFLADSDMWLFTSIPSQFSDVVFTTGYSIENDVYAESSIDGLLSPDELNQFSLIKQSLIRWFSFEVEEYRASSTCKVKVKLSKIIPFGTTNLCPIYLAARGFREPQQSTLLEIGNSYRLLIRGKSLEDAWMRLLNSESRTAKHSRSTLLETFIKINPSRHIQRLIQELRQRMSTNITFRLTSN